MALLRETYEGTPLDMTQNLKVTVKDRKTGKVDTIISPKANPWMRGDELNMLNGIKRGCEISTQYRSSAMCLFYSYPIAQLAARCSRWCGMVLYGQSRTKPARSGILWHY